MVLLDLDTRKVMETMDQAHEAGTGLSSEDSEVDSEREDRPPASKRKYQGSATYSTRYDCKWRGEYPCIEAIKGDPYSFFCSTCSKKVSCKHMGIGDIKRHVDTASHKRMAMTMEHQSKLTFVFSRDPIRQKVSNNFPH